MSETSRTQADFWAACYETDGLMASEQGRLLVFNFTPTSRRGVWRLQARACDVVDGRPVRVVVQRSVEWPNADTARLEAQAYRLALAVLEEARTDGLEAEPA